MKNKVLVIILFVILIFNVFSAEIVFSGICKLDFPLMINTDNFMQSGLNGITEIASSISVFSGIYDFYLEGNIFYENNESVTGFSIDECCLSFDNFDFISFKLGRFSYLPGMADLFSNTNYFILTDYEALITGDIENSYISTDLLQFVLYYSDFYLFLTAEPFPGNSLFPEPESPWFPAGGLPKSITINFLGEYEMLLDSVYLEEPETEVFNFKNVSVSAEMGGTTGPVDFSLIYFHGRDNTPLLQGRIDFPQGLFENYDIYLKPVNSLIDAFGLNIAAAFSDFRLWADISHTLLKTFSTNKLSASNFENELMQSPSFEYSAGGSYELYSFDQFNAFFLLEYSGSWIVNSNEYIIEPAFSSVLSGMAVLNFLQDKLSIYATALVSHKDWSFVQIYTILFSPEEELELKVFTPFFSGETDSDFGQYKDNHLVSFNITWRF